MTMHKFILCIVSVSALFAQAAFGAEVAIAPQEPAIAASVIPPIPTLKNQCMRQQKGLFLVSACLQDIFALKSPELLTPLGPVGSWLESKLYTKGSSITTADEATATVLTHAAIIEFFAHLLDGQTANLTPLDPEKKYNEIITAITAEQTKEIAQLIELVNTHINSLLPLVSSLYQEQLTEIVTTQRTQLSRIQEILQLIVIKLGQSKLENRKAIKEQIMGLRNQIQMAYQGINQQGISPALVRQLHGLMYVVVEQLEDAGREMNAITPLKEEEVNRSIQAVDFATLQEEMAELTNRIAALEKYAEIADLSFFERSARLLSDYLLSPLYRHRYLFGLVLGTAATIAVAAWHLLVIRDYGPEVGGRHLIGPAESHDRATVAMARTERANWDRQHGNPNAVPGRENWASHINNFIVEIMTGKTPVLYGTGIFTGWMAKKTWDTYHLGEKLENTLNILKGGIYRQNVLKKTHDLQQVTFDDVIGMDHAKEVMMQIFGFLKNPERWILAGINIPTTLLLTGDTRSGKTFFANACRGEGIRQLQGQINFTFREITIEQIREIGFKEILEVAKTYWAPCIIWIDELHLLHLQDMGNAKVLSELLTGLSGLETPDPKRPVIVMAGTNKPETINNALRQKGRFAIEIRCTYPSIAERREFMLRKLTGYGIDPRAFHIDLDRLARETEGCTFEVLASLISDAFIHINMHGGTLNHELLEQSVDREIRKIIFHDNHVIADTELQFLSSFWAGVTIAAHELCTNQKISCVTTNPVIINFKEEMLGKDLIVSAEEQTKEKQTGIVRGKIWTYHEKDPAGFESMEDRVAHIKMYLAGRAAERIIMGSTSTYNNSRRQWAFEQIKEMITQGLDFAKLPQQTQHEIVQKAQEQLAQYEQEVEVLLNNNKQTLTILEQVLRKVQKLNGQQIEMIIEQAKKNGEELLKALSMTPESMQAEMEKANWLEMLDQASATPVAA